MLTSIVVALFHKLTHPKSVHKPCSIAESSCVPNSILWHNSATIYDSSVERAILINKTVIEM